MNTAATESLLTPSYDVPNGQDPTEWQTRVELAACYRMIDYYGWTSQVYNHITARIPGTDQLLINPFGLRYDEITASNLVKIDIDGNKLDKSPYPVNRAGYVIHSAIHAVRHDLQCTLHTHSPSAEALSCLDVGFIPMTQTGCMFYERVGYHDYCGIALDEEERQSLIADMGTENHTLVLRNHGVLIGAPNIAWALTRLFHFENASATQLKVMASGGTITRLSHEVMSRTRQQFEGGDSQAGALVQLPEWPAALRLLDKRDPTWRT
ncbi:MAG: class II aldolase/adducin family protein [Burkholderiaceae bacterium]